MQANLQMIRFVRGRNDHGEEPGVPPVSDDDCV